MLWPPASLGYRPAAVLDLTAEERIEYYALLSGLALCAPISRIQEETALGLTRGRGGCCYE